MDPITVAGLCLVSYGISAGSPRPPRWRFGDEPLVGSLRTRGHSSLCGLRPPWDPNCPPAPYTKVDTFLIRTDLKVLTWDDGPSLRMATQGGLVGGNLRRGLEECVICERGDVPPPTQGISATSSRPPYRSHPPYQCRLHFHLREAFLFQLCSFFEHCSNGL